MVTFYGINEFGTNFDPKIFDPKELTETPGNFYEELCLYNFFKKSYYFNKKIISEKTICRKHEPSDETPYRNR